MSDPRERIQEEAYSAWKENGHRGTIEAITGIGKTFIALRAIADLPEDSNILFLAETTARWKDLNDDIAKYRSLYGIDLSNRNITQMCYQSAYKERGMVHDLVICDEIHDSLSPEYAKYYVYNCSVRIMGLSATIEDGELLILGRNMSKISFLSEFAPICYSYGLQNGQSDGTTRQLKIHVIEHALDSNTRNISAGTLSKPFMTTEVKSYEYWDKKFKQSMYMDPDRREYLMRHSVRKRAELLYTLPSKVKMVKELLGSINGKTLIFGNHLDTLSEITPNVIRSPKPGESKAERELMNTNIRNQFDNDEINVIASFKMLKQGANLKGVDNLVIMSYFGKERDMIQRCGRLRLNGETIGNVYIPVTVGTQEVKWFEEMTRALEGIEFVTIPLLI